MILMLFVLLGLQQPPDIFVIRGAKNPELLPEYVVWSEAFPVLSILKEERWDGQRGPKLSAQDRKLVYEHAALYTPREEACTAKRDRAWEALKADEAKRDKEVRAIELECRWQILEAKDRVLAALSPEGAAIFQTWVVQEVKPHITVTVSKADYEFFKLPY
jgi:hypothetical protein